MSNGSTECNKIQALKPLLCMSSLFMQLT
jgi:hypothetical protein